MARKPTGQPIGRRRRLPYGEIADIYSTGASAVSIAKHFGAHHTSILYVLWTMGIDTSPKATRARRWETKLAARPAFISRSGFEKAREDYLLACKLKSNTRIERMMSLACPKRKRYAA